MDRRACVVLGKRGRRVAGSEPIETDQIAAPKRSRARRVNYIKEEIEAPPSGMSTTKPRSGLLTLEPSTLTESQMAPAGNDKFLPRQSTFPFTKLPAELRLHVYHMALVRAEPLFLHADRVPEKHDEDTRPSFTAQGLFANIPDTTYPVRTDRRSQRHVEPREDRIRLKDPVVPEILRLNKQIYKEARQLLYSENVFTLSLASGIHTLSSLHQRSRSLIKHVVLTIPSHHDILDGFADLVRLGLRYCWGLKSFRIILQATLPDDGRVGGTTSVYANAFHILRWLPRGCSVMLEGCVSETVRRVVVEEGRLMNVLDETSYLKRQHQMPERR